MGGDRRVRLFDRQLAIVRDDSPLIYVGGGWGSGKSTAAWARFVRALAENPWTPAHGDDWPWFGVFGPGGQSLEVAMMSKAKQWLWNRVIRVRQKPALVWHLDSWQRVVFASFGSTFEGADLSSVLIDEVHLADDQTFRNLLMRVRDPRAPKRSTIACGLPMDGWLRTTFDRVPQPRTQSAHLLASSGNPFLDPVDLEKFRNACADGEQATYLEGRWISRLDAVFPQFSSSLYPEGNVIALAGDRTKPTFLALDVGNTGFALFGQIRAGAAGGADQLHIVDHLPLSGLGAEELAIRARARGWRIAKIFTDPTLRVDEIRAVERVFPGVPQVRAQKADPRWSIDYGIDAIRRACKDSTGKRRLVIAEHLATPKREGPDFDPTRGVYQCIVNSRLDPRTQLPRKQNQREEHGRDCLRYLVVWLLPAERVGTWRVR